MLALCVLLGAAGIAGAEELSAGSRAEIDHLLEYLGQSECRFERNDKWYEASDAVAHLNRKLSWLLKRGLVDSAEQFIERAASESSRSGKPYQVQCGTGPPVTSREWFTAELERLRSGGR